MNQEINEKISELIQLCLEESKSNKMEVNSAIVLSALLNGREINSTYNLAIVSQELMIKELETKELQRQALMN